MTYAQAVAKHGDRWGVEFGWRERIGDVDSFTLMRNLTGFRWPPHVRNSFVMGLARGSKRDRDVECPK